MGFVGLSTGIFLFLAVGACLCRPFASEFEQLTDEVERLMNDVKRSIDLENDTPDEDVQERNAIPVKIVNETATKKSETEGKIVKDATATEVSSPSNATLVKGASNSNALEASKVSDLNGIPEAVKDDLNAKVREGERLTTEQGAPVPTSAELKAKEKESDKSTDAKSSDDASKTIDKAVSEAVDSVSKSTEDTSAATPVESSNIQSSKDNEKQEDNKAHAKSQVAETTDDQKTEQTSETEDQRANSQESTEDNSASESAAETNNQDNSDSEEVEKPADQHESASDQEDSREAPGAEATEETAATSSPSETEKEEDRVKMFFISPFEEDNEAETQLGTEDAQARQILTYPATGHGWGHSHQWGPSHIWNSDYPYFAYGYSWGCGHHGYGPHHSMKKSEVDKNKRSDAICRDYVLIPAVPRANVLAPQNVEEESGTETGTVRQVVSKDVACNDDDPQCTARQVIGSMAGGSMFGDGMGGLGIGFPGVPGIHTGISGYNEAGGFGDHIHGHGHGHGHGHHGGGYSIGGGGYGHGGYFVGGNDHGFSGFWSDQGDTPMDPKEEAAEKKNNVKKGNKALRRNFGAWVGGGFGFAGSARPGSGSLISFNMPPLSAPRLSLVTAPKLLAGAAPTAGLVTDPWRADESLGSGGFGKNPDGYLGWGSFGPRNWGGWFGGFGNTFYGPSVSPVYGNGGYGSSYASEGYEYGTGEGVGRPYLGEGGLGNGRPYLGEGDLGNGYVGGYGGGFGDDELGGAVGIDDYPGLQGAISHGGFHSALTYKSKIKGKKHTKKTENNAIKSATGTARQDIAMPDEQALMDVTKQRQLIGSLGASTLFGDNVGGIGLGHPGVPQMSSGVSGIPGEYGGSGGYSHGWEGEGPGMHPHGYNDYGYNFGHGEGEHEEGYDKSTTPHAFGEEQGEKKQLIVPGVFPTGNLLPVGHDHGHFAHLANTEHVEGVHHAPAVPITIPYTGFPVSALHDDGFDRDFDGGLFGDGFSHDDDHIIGPLGVVDHRDHGNVFGPIGHIESHDIHHETGDHYGGQILHESHQVAHIGPHGFDPLVYHYGEDHDPKHVHVGVGTPNVKVEVETDKSKIGKPLSHVTAQKMSEIKKLVKDVSNSIKRTGEKLKAMKKGRVTGAQGGKRQITPAFTPVTAEPAAVPDIRYPVPSADRYPLGAGYIWPSANYGHQYGGPYAWSKSHTPSTKKEKGGKAHKRHKAHKKGKRAAAVSEPAEKDSTKERKTTVGNDKASTKRQYVSRTEMFDRAANGYPYHGGMAIYGYGMGYPVHGAGAAAAYGPYAGHGSYGIDGYGGHGLGGHGIVGYGRYGGYGHGLGGRAAGIRYVSLYGHGDLDHGELSHYGGHGGFAEGYDHGGGYGHGLGGYDGHHEFGGYVGHGFSAYQGHALASVPVGGIGGISGYGHGFEAIHGDVGDHGGFSHFGEFSPFSAEPHAANGLHYVGGNGGFGGIGGVGGLGPIAALGAHEVGYPGYGIPAHPGYGIPAHAGYGSGYGFTRQEIEGASQSEGSSEVPMAAMSRSQMPEEPMMVPETPQAEFNPEAMYPRFTGYPGSKKSDVPKVNKEKKEEKVPVKGKA